MYGLCMGGLGGARLLRALCAYTHNMAMRNPVCAAVVAEVARGDPVAAAVPRWRSFSSGEDVWCMKRLGSHEEEDGDDNNDDWVASPPSSGKVIFVDPREF